MIASRSRGTSRSAADRSGEEDRHDTPLAPPRSDGSSSFRRSLSSTFSSFPSLSSFSSAYETSPTPSRQRLLRTSSICKSLQRLDSRLSITCSGSDLSQLYLSGPEQDADQKFPRGNNENGDDAIRGRNDRRQSWLQAADFYGRRTSFRRINSYNRFLGHDMMSDIVEDGEDEEGVLLIEETYQDGNDRPNKSSPIRRCLRTLKSSGIVVPAMMVIDLILGVSLSLYDSNLLRNVPGFRFPLVYAFTQKLTNAVASLVLICLSRKWERVESKRSRHRPQDHSTKMVVPANNETLTPLPTMRNFKRHAVPLTAVALVQTISAAFANQALLSIPLPLFKVCLMCGPIFVAFMSKMMDGKLYSWGRMAALALIGAGACRAVYAEMESADNPRYVVMGASYALGASAFSGIGLVLSSVLMHRGGNDSDPAEDGDTGEEREQLINRDDAAKSPEEDKVQLNPLSLLFYLSCEQVIMLSAYLCPWDDIVLQRQQSINEEQIIEKMDEISAFSIYVTERPAAAISYLMTGSMISLSLAVLTFVLVNRTSPVATSLLGNVRSITTVAISSTLFLHGSGDAGSRGGGAGLFGSAALGYSCTLAGGVAYAIAALGKDAMSPPKS